MNDNERRKARNARKRRRLQLMPYPRPQAPGPRPAVDWRLVLVVVGIVALHVWVFWLLFAKPDDYWAALDSGLHRPAAESPR